MRSPSTLFGAAALFVTVLARPGLAQSPSDETKARTLFGEGNALYDRGDYVGALEAYRSSYALAKYPVILFNLGLVHAKLGRSVEAVAAMERVLAAPGRLKPRRITKAREVLAAQRARIAELRLACSEDGATVLVDGREVGTTPLASLRVAEGRRVLMVRKEGYRAEYAEVKAKGGAEQPVTIELTPVDKRPAQVEILTKLPGAEVRVDGQLVAVTPLLATIPVTPGERHQISLMREGYLPAQQVLTLSEGATSKIVLQPELDPSLQPRGELVVSLGQDDASVFVDGIRRELASGGHLPLPAGPHDLVGQRTGYDPLRLRIEMPSEGTVEAQLDLIPTPETRAQLIGDAELSLGLGWGLTAGGAVLTATGVGLMVWSIGERQQRVAAIDACTASADCSVDELGAIAIEQDNFTRVAVGAGIGTAVGLGMVIPGIYFLLTGEDPDRYRLRIDDAEFVAGLAPLNGGASAGVTGRF